MQKPEIFKFHDSREYLGEMIVYLKKSDRHLTQKKIAQDLGITPSYLTMIRKGKRDLTLSIVHDLAKLFNLTAQEESYLELLVNFNNSQGDLAKSKIFSRMKNFKRYRELNPQETKLYEYMSNWINVVIREMTALENFRDDPNWIKERIKFPTTLEEIKVSLRFLKEKNYINKNNNGTFDRPGGQISCMDKIYTNALIRFHRSFLKLAGDSTTYADSEERKLLGHCVVLEEKNITKAQDIIQEAYEKIQSLQKSTDKGDIVYFVELAVFPLTQGDSDD